MSRLYAHTPPTRAAQAAPSPLQRKAEGGGSPLPSPVRAKMERSFGHSFADVRIHSGGEAEQIGALAYTRGPDVHFQPGLYDPLSLGGQELLGHELAHVVQQSTGRVAAPQSKAAGGSAADGYAAGGSAGQAPVNADAGLEAEADALGARAARGLSAPVSGRGAGGGGASAGVSPLQRKTDKDPGGTPADFSQLDLPQIDYSGRGLPQFDFHPNLSQSFPEPAAPQPAPLDLDAAGQIHSAVLAAQAQPKSLGGASAAGSLPKTASLPTPGAPPAGGSVDLGDGFRGQIKGTTASVLVQDGGFGIGPGIDYKKGTPSLNMTAKGEHWNAGASVSPTSQQIEATYSPSEDISAGLNAHVDESGKTPAWGVGGQIKIRY